MNDKKQFKFYRSYFEVAEEIESREDRLDFLMAILKRHFYSEQPNLQGVAKFAYISQKHSIEAQCKGYEDKLNGLSNPIKGGNKGGKEAPSIQSYNNINLQSNNLESNNLENDNEILTDFQKIEQHPHLNIHAITDLVEFAKTDEIYKDNFKRLYQGISYEKALKGFETHLRKSGILRKSYTEFQNHFMNWINKKDNGQ